MRQARWTLAALQLILRCERGLGGVCVWLGALGIFVGVKEVVAYWACGGNDADSVHEKT